MAEDADTAQPDDALASDPVAMRDEDGEIRPQFVEQITDAIHEADVALLRATVAELHEADLGDLVAALEPDDRVTLVELSGSDFDFSALNEVDDSDRRRGRSRA
jgi:magnesium transporter